MRPSPARAPLALGLALALGACSDDRSGPGPGSFDELCGARAPLHLLPLNPDRIAQIAWGQAFADRYVFAMHYGDPLLADIDIWSVGQCGEDPIRLAEGENYYWRGPDEKWPEVVFVCDHSSGEMLTLDPMGAAPAHVVFEARLRCPVLETALGWVTVLGEGDTGALVLQRWPDDPLTEVAEQVVLVDAVKAHSVPNFGPSDPVMVLRVIGDEVFAITTDDELVVVSLPDLEVSVLAQDVREFLVAPTGRYLLWQGMTVTLDHPERPEGPVFVLDRESGESTQIAETAVDYARGSFGLEDMGLLYYQLERSSTQGNIGRWLTLDTLEPYAPLDQMVAVAQIDETRVFVADAKIPAQSFHVFDRSTGERSLLYDGPWRNVISVLDADPRLLIQREDGGAVIGVRPTGEIGTLARHTSLWWTVLSGDRVVTPFAVGDDKIGSLVVVNPDTLAEMFVDHDVLDRSLGVIDRPSRHSHGGDVLHYMVVDADPERHGIWLAKPAK